MDRLKIISLFTIFTGEEFDEKLEPFIDIAIAQLEDQLIESPMRIDTRVEFLCAALANYHFRLARSSADGSEFTYAGKITAAERRDQLEYARRMVMEYRAVCRDFLKQEELVLMGFSGKEQI